MRSPTLHGFPANTCFTNHLSFFGEQELWTELVSEHDVVIMRQIYALVLTLLIALVPLAAATEPFPTDTIDILSPTTEDTSFESPESQSTSRAPTSCADESSAGDLLLSDVKIGCDESGEYFSESDGTVNIVDSQKSESIDILESNYDSSNQDRSTINICEGSEDIEQPEFLGDIDPDDRATEATLYASIQPSRVKNITVESEHPYADSYTYTWEISDPDAHQMRLHFDKLSLAKADYIGIYDEMGRELVSYGDRNYATNGADFWIGWQTTDVLRVKLTTDSSGSAYGFLIDKVECRDEVSPPTEHLAESYHPYANNYVYTWEISKPGAHQMRLHFDKLSLAKADFIRIYDEMGRELVVYGDPNYAEDYADIWTGWQTTDTLRIKLSTSNSGTAYGFLIDRVECRNETSPPTPPTKYPVESYHPYANNYVYTWKISEPGAHQMRLHFDKLSLAKADFIRIYDEMGRELVSYGDPNYAKDYSDIWTEWQTTDTLRVKLSTGNSGTAYGFLIDKVDRRNEISPATEHFAESYHPYANNYAHTWDISMPGANKTRLHFNKLSLAKSDTLRIYDVQGKQLVRYDGAYDGTDLWSEW